jgi:hypothetical protein
LKVGPAPRHLFFLPRNFTRRRAYQFDEGLEKADEVLEKAIVRKNTFGNVAKM